MKSNLEESRCDYSALIVFAILFNFIYDYVSIFSCVLDHLIEVPFFLDQL